MSASTPPEASLIPISFPYIAGDPSVTLSEPVRIVFGRIQYRHRCLERQLYTVNSSSHVFLRNHRYFMLGSRYCIRSIES